MKQESQKKASNLIIQKSILHQLMSPRNKIYDTQM